jgi:hypothetical protein
MSVSSNNGGTVQHEQLEPSTPTNAAAIPTEFALALEQLLGYERFWKGSKAHLRQTQHPNALPAS